MHRTVQPSSKQSRHTRYLSLLRYGPSNDERRLRAVSVLGSDYCRLSDGTCHCLEQPGTATAGANGASGHVGRVQVVKPANRLTGCEGKRSFCALAVASGVAAGCRLQVERRLDLLGHVRRTVWRGVS